MERNVEPTRPKRAIAKPARYVVTSSENEPRKRIRLVPVSTLEDDIAENQETLTIDTDDTQTIDRDAYEQTHTEPVCSNTLTYMDMPGTSTMRVRNTHTDSDIQTLVWDEFQKIHTKLDKLEGMFTKLLKQQQPRGCPVKPMWLPITTVAEMREFETAVEAYNDVVRYLQYVGGYNLKEAVNLCFKEAIDNNLLVRYSWRGMEPDKLCLRDTKIVKAIHDAVIGNKHYQRPSKREVEANLVAALRTAKERVRSRAKRQLYMLQPPVAPIFRTKVKEKSKLETD